MQKYLNSASENGANFNRADLMRRPQEIKFIHTETKELITPEMKSEIEVLFADLLFEAWLKEKNHPPSGPAPGSSA